MGAMRVSRRCLGCPRIIPATSPRGRCPECLRTWEAERGTRQQRGYGNRHDRLRTAYQTRMDAGEAFTCWRCGRPIDQQRWHLGHDDRDRNRYRGPECVACNTATSSHRAGPGGWG